MESGSTDQMPRHPFLSEPVLYVNGLPEYVRDQDIAQALEACVPFRPQIVREGSGYSHGSILFKSLERAEKALATVNGKPIPGVHPPTVLNLEAFLPHLSPRSRPTPTARPRIVSNLPPNFTDSRLFDIFRGYGPISSARLQPNLGPDVAIIEFWREDDARRAEETMHCSEVDDCSITVHAYHPPRKAEFNVAAPSFIPSGIYPRFGPGSPPLPQSPLLYSPSPPRSNLPYPRSPSMHGGSPLPSYHSSPFMHGPGQQVQFAPPSGPGSSSASGLIDPCNLFCKNLDLDIDSNALFAQFRRFGQIVSARVMRNEHGVSRGFGFVSFQTPDQATRAMQTMNGTTLGTKQIVVRLHEPKQLRKEKLEKRFGGHNGHPRSHSGATSPTLSEGGLSSSGWPPHDARPRRSSGSYFHAALNGSLNLPMRYDDLSALSPVVRSEVLNGELLRRVRETDGVEEDEIDDIVRLLMDLSLDQIVSGLQDRHTFLGQIENARQARQPQPLSAPVLDALNEPIALPPTSRAASTSSTLLDPQTLAATASAPEHPSTPVSFNPSVATPPRTASPTGSFATAGQGEKERLYNAVARLEPQSATEITDLLLSLNKKERALCLFNADYLKSKVESAKSILSVLEDDPVPTPPANKPENTGPNQETPPRRAATQSGSPKTPDLSYSRGPSVAASPAAPVTPNTTSMAIPPSSTSTSTTTTAVHTLATLAKLPATEILKIAGGNPVATTGLPLPKADPLVTRSTDEFIDSIQGRSIAQQKQAVGDKLFKVIKAFGIKGAPKITISLLDTEDLRALAHVMNSYPAVLKEKVLMQAATAAAK